MHQVSGSWRCLWLFSWQRYESFHHLSPLGPLWVSMEGSTSQLHPKLCSPAVLGNISCWVWSRAGWQCSPPPSQSRHKSWGLRLNWKFAWKDTKTRIPIYKASAEPVLICCLFGATDLLLLTLSEVTEMEYGDKLEAAWEFTGWDSAGQRGVSGTVSAPVPGCLWNEFTHDVASSFSCSNCNKETPSCFKQAAAQVILLRANESNASCLTDQPGCLSPPPTLQGKANFLVYTVFSWLGVFV